jgi:hypothetical protein
MERDHELLGRGARDGLASMFQRRIPQPRQRFRMRGVSRPCRRSEVGLLTPTRAKQVVADVKVAAKWIRDAYA